MLGPKVNQRVNPLPPRRFAWVLGLLGFVISFAGLLPYYLEYLQIPNRNLLQWDMALHARDGLALYLQLKRLDLISFLWSMINMSFWMPLHPLLVALVSVFAPFKNEAYVLLNYFVLSGGLGWAFYLVGRSARLSVLQKCAFCAGMLYFTFRIGNSPQFWITHLNVMIESLGVGLTMVFAVASLLETSEADSPLYRRTSIISLSLLCFTKIQYGMFFGAVYILRYLWTDRAFLFGPGGYFLRMWAELRARRVLLVFCGLLFVSGAGLIVSRQNVADGISSAVFSVVLAVSFLRSAREEGSAHLRDLYRFLIIPFGWFYFFPVKNKVRHLLYNANTAAVPESWADKFSALPGNLVGDYLAIPVWAAVVLLGSALWVSAWLLWKRREGARSLVLYGWALVLGFYLPMSVASVARIARFSVTWIAAVAAVYFLFVVFSFRSRILLGAATLLCLAGSFREFRAQPLSKMHQSVAENGFLQPGDKGLQQVLSRFDFSRPGVIYGLGSVMDQSTILFELKILERHPEYSSVFSKREQRDLIANDFGRDKNSDPSAEILRRAESPELKQIVLYPAGFQPQVFAALRTKLSSAPFDFQASFETPDVLFLSR